MGEALIVGTSNPAKKQMIQSALAPLGILIQGTDELGVALDVEEDELTAQANARKKSLAYTQAVGRPVLSMDNALYLDGLTADAQPGVYTGRIGGRAQKASEIELLAHYITVIERLGGAVDGHWEFGVCLANPAGAVFERTIISPRKFVSTPSPTMIPGYPLESLQIEPSSGRYISEMSADEQAAFWQRIIGRQLCYFVREAAHIFAIGL